MAFSGLLTDYLGEGLAASRPVAPNLSPGACGVYYATDTDVTSIWDGSTWHNLGSAGTVSSVALALPSSILTVSGSPVTSTGTLTGALATQTANEVWAGPTTGSAAAPTFRALGAADLPLGTTSAPGALQPDGTTITVTGGVISSAGGGGVAGLPPIVDTQFVYSFTNLPIAATAVGTPAASTANAPRALRVTIPVNCNVSMLAVVGAAGGTGAEVSLALYTADATTGYPANLVQGFNLNLTATGTVLSTSAANITAGSYWLFYNHNVNGATATLRSVSLAPVDGGSPLSLASIAGGLIPGVLRLASTLTYTSTAPSSLSAVTWAPATNAPNLLLPYLFRVNSI